MKCLVACEESQAVVTEMRKLGHEAYSCDLEECSGGHPEWHIHGDALKLLHPYIIESGGAFGNEYRLGVDFNTQDGEYHVVYGRWDLIIAHPPCTYLTNAGARWLWANGCLNKERYAKGIEAKAFFMKFWNADCSKVAIENPIPSSVFNLPPCTQAIQPYEYGHPYSKKTCLWLKGLPVLKPTNVIESHVPYITSGSYSKTHDPKYKGASRKGGSAKSRSKTFKGIAQAMAEQWAGKVNEEVNFDD